jgi:hypothetical protein
VQRCPRVVVEHVELSTGLVHAVQTFDVVLHVRDESRKSEKKKKMKNEK